MFRTSPDTEFRTAELWLIAAVLGVVAIGAWGVGLLIGSPLLRFAGFMAGATTFLPLPADAYVLSASAGNPALVLAVIGGAVNAVVVLIEREWLLQLARHPVFDRFAEFIGTNRWVDMAQRHLFLGLVIGGISFLPFEPFRLVAVFRGYPPIRYAVATFLGRGFRYYWLARVGSVFAVYGIIKYVVWISLAVFGVGLLRSYLRFRTTADRRV